MHKDIKYFLKNICNFREKWEINLTILHTVPCINPWLFTIFVKSKVSFMRNAFCLVSCPMAAQLHRIAFLVTFTDEIPNGKLHFLCSVRSRRRTFLLIEIIIKNMSRKLLSFCANSFGDLVKDLFLRAHDCSRNMFKNTRERHCLFVFLVMLPEHVHMDSKFRGPLKPSISFIVNHFPCA